MFKKLTNLWIIDDDPMTSFYIKRLAELGELANIITIHNNAQGALDYLTAHTNSEAQLPEIILLDIYMPGLDGWGFIKQFQQLREQICKPISIYIISSSNHPNDFSRARELPEITDYFEKPVTIDILKEMVVAFQEQKI